MRFSTTGGEPFAHRLVELFAPQGREAFQTGRTDAEGRFAFVPVRPGTWQMRVSAPDGHGSSVSIDVDTNHTAKQEQPPFGKTPGVVLGIGILLALFGVMALFGSRRSTPDQSDGGQGN